MTEKIADEVDTQIRFGQKCQKSAKIVFFNAFLTPSKKVGPNLKPYSERFLFEFYENGKQKLPTTIND